jgi:hypothetical protein
VRRVLRVALETVLFGLLAAVMLLGVIWVARRVIDDVKVQYFTIGYYVAVHRAVVLWLWKKTGIEKTPPA